MIDFIVTGSNGFLGKELIKQIENTNLNAFFLYSSNGDILNKKFWQKLMV